MKAKPTMQEVARAAGYSRAAVSLALRGDRTIPEGTRQHITRVALSLGYRANPLVSALMSLHRQRRSVMGATTAIAYLTSHATEDPWRSQKFCLDLFKGASERATEIGCRLEEFNLKAENMTPARMREILHTRSIHAAIVGPLPRGETQLGCDISSLAVVGLGMSVNTPVIERVSNDHFQSAALAVERCHAAGYRRIGFALSQESSQRLNHRWLGGFRFAVEQYGLKVRIPPLMPQRADELPAALPLWLRAHQPDVVVLGNSDHEMRAQVPVAVGLVALGVEEPDGALTGIYQNFPLLGRIAVEHAMGKLYTITLGSPEEVHIHVVAGTWAPGVTAPGPRRRRPSAAMLKSQGLVTY